MRCKMCFDVFWNSITTHGRSLHCYYVVEWLKYINSKSFNLVTLDILYSVLYQADCLLVVQSQFFLSRLTFMLLLTQVQNTLASAFLSFTRFLTESLLISWGFLVLFSYLQLLVQIHKYQWSRIGTCLAWALLFTC